MGAKNPQDCLVDSVAATIPVEGHSPKLEGSNTCSRPEGSERLEVHLVVGLISQQTGVGRLTKSGM